MKTKKVIVKKQRQPTVFELVEKSEMHEITNYVEDLINQGESLEDIIELIRNRFE